MRLLAVPFVLAVASLAFASAAQVTPPSGPPKAAGASQPKSACYELRLVHIEEETHRYARVQTGDKWISGCLGNEGACLVPIWIRC